MSKQKKYKMLALLSVLVMIVSIVIGVIGCIKENIAIMFTCIGVFFGATGFLIYFALRAGATCPKCGGKLHRTGEYEDSGETVVNRNSQGVITGYSRLYYREYACSGCDYTVVKKER